MIVTITEGTKLNVTCQSSVRAAYAARGATLMESVVAMAIIGILFIALYGGIGFGIRSLQLSRENLRATQILVEKMEGIRLYNWDQVSSNGFLPLTFTQSYYTTPTNVSPSSTTASRAQGVVYYGRVTVTNVPFSTTYAAEMKMVQVELNWTSAVNVARSRVIRTFVSQYGLQNYLY